MENKVVGDWLKLAGVEKKVGVPGTTGTAWRHIGYSRLHIRDVRGALVHEKRCFSYFSQNRDRPAVVQFRQAPPSTSGR